jgi:hypothetical protein
LGQLWTDDNDEHLVLGMGKCKEHVVLTNSGMLAARQASTRGSSKTPSSNTHNYNKRAWTVQMGARDLSGDASSRIMLSRHALSTSKKSCRASTSCEADYLLQETNLVMRSLDRGHYASYRKIVFFGFLRVRIESRSLGDGVAGQGTLLGRAVTALTIRCY